MDKQYNVWRITSGKTTLIPITGESVSLQEACQLVELLEKGKTLIGLPSWGLDEPYTRQDGYMVLVGATITQMYVICIDDYDTVLLNIAASAEAPTKRWG